MTDKEKLVGLLTEFGIPYKEMAGEDTDVSSQVVFGRGNWEYETEKSEQVSGYIGFYTSFNFDGNGSFLFAGAWE